MNSPDELDRRINLQLEDRDTDPAPDFTARVLERIAEEKLVAESKRKGFRLSWVILPLAAAIALALLPFSPQTEESESPETGNNLLVEIDNPGPQPEPLSALQEMEELLVMEESLRDFEILFDDDALEILALLDK